MDENTIKSFLQIPYESLEELNLASKKRRASSMSQAELKTHYLDYLKKEKRIKAVTISFSDLEGRLHMLDYDKKFFLSAYDGLTFDGSSVRGFSRQVESDLRLGIDWGSFWWLPSDIFGPGKVMIMGRVLNQDGTVYPMDLRGRLAEYLKHIEKMHGYTAYIATEVEGFLLKGPDAEKEYEERQGFSLVSSGGYYHSLPTDTLRIFIDRCAEAQRAMGFENEKDHPEVAPSQFELNYSYADALTAADQVMLYKLICRQVARNMGMTASFLPKPIVGINGSGMHTNISLSKNGKNIFHDKKGNGYLSPIAWTFIDRILTSANDMCLALNPSVNAYRRLDPHYEAPNEIKVSEKDRGSMIRIPVHTEKSARIEVRSVAPDANPYLVFFTLLKTGIEGQVEKKSDDKRPRVRCLPGTIQSAIQAFRQSEWMSQALDEDVKKRYLDLKEMVADRSPLELGTRVKKGEVIYHHEVYNQLLWNEF